MENCFRLIFQRPELFNGTLYLHSFLLSLSLAPPPRPPSALLIMIHTMKQGARSYFNLTWRVIVRSSRSRWVKKLTVNLKGLDGGKIYFIYHMFHALNILSVITSIESFSLLVVARKTGDEEREKYLFRGTIQYNIDTNDNCRCFCSR